MTPGWLGTETARLRAAFAAGRLPHALLVHEAPGTGGEWLALWAARMVLCSNRAEAPCGHCGPCQRVAQGLHPDLTFVRPLETSTQIRIEGFPSEEVRNFFAIGMFLNVIASMELLGSKEKWAGRMLEGLWHK